MNAMTSLLYALAIIGSILSGVFYYLTNSNADTLNSELELSRDQLSRSQSISKELRDKNLELAKQIKLKNESLNEALSNITVLDARNNQYKRETLRYSEELEERATNDEKLRVEISRLGRALAELRATSVDITEVEEYQRKISRLENEILKLQDTQRSFPASIAESNDAITATQADLRGKILTVGPKSSFVVLNIGYDSGIRLANALDISRFGETIAKIQITEVKENLSIARILPESLKTPPQQGDIVTSD